MIGGAALGLGGLVLLSGGGVLIGFLLAVLGAGGSILLLPLLVSGAGLATQEAVPLSLLVVILLALFNLGPYAWRRQLAWRPALILGLPAMAGSLLGGRLVRAGYVSEPMQLGMFAVAAVVASWLLIRPQPANPAPGARPRRAMVVLASQGVVLGLLTGIAGVGGGFAIVPALVLLGGLPMPLASGTSLLLIPLNALIALLALGHWPATSLPLMVPLLLGGGFGGVIGQWLAPRISDRRLRQGFAMLVIGSALLIGVEAWRRHHGSAGSFSTQISSRESTELQAPQSDRGEAGRGEEAGRGGEAHRRGSAQ